MGIRGSGFRPSIIRIIVAKARMGCIVFARECTQNGPTKVALEHGQTWTCLLQDSGVADFNLLAFTVRVCQAWSRARVFYIEFMNSGARSNCVVIWNALISAAVIHK